MANKAAAGNGTIRKKKVQRNGKNYVYWEGRVTIGTDPGTGAQMQKSFSGKTQAEVARKMREAVKAIDTGTFIESSKLTVDQWTSEWITSYCTGKLKPLTLENYQLMLKRYISPAIGSVKLQSLRGSQIQAIYNGMTKRGLSGKTVKNVGSILHKCLSVAVKQGLIPMNPCDSTEMPKVRMREIKPLTDAEIPLFFQAIRGHEYENLWAVCLLCGLREGEALGLSWDSVDFDAGRITICQQLQCGKSAGSRPHIEHSTKSGKIRTIAPPLEAFQFLKAEKRRQTEWRLLAGEVWGNEDNLVFTDRLGHYISIDTFFKRFKRVVATIGRPDLRPHDLRHTCATLAIATGSDIKSVQSLMGHATASFTLNVYAHTSEKMMEDTANRLHGYYKDIIAQA